MKWGIKAVGAFMAGAVLFASTPVCGMLAYQGVEAWIAAMGWEGWKAVPELTSIAVGLVMLFAACACVGTAIWMIENSEHAA